MDQQESITKRFVEAGEKAVEELVDEVFTDSSLAKVFPHELVEKSKEQWRKRFMVAWLEGAVFGYCEGAVAGGNAVVVELASKVKEMLAPDA